MKGYKVFNPDWTCRGFQYKIGETFTHHDKMEICESGFHFCRKINDCFNYYPFDSDNKVAEIEALGAISTHGDESVTDVIKIVREISWSEVLELSNHGKNCTGIGNTGDYNSGNHNSGYGNSGDYNSGSHNSGAYNSGHFNSGYENSGNYNSGNNNSGCGNSGNYNSGNNNSGNFNSCDFSNGFFNSVSPPLYAFNKPLNISREEFLSCDGMRILRQNFWNAIWIHVDDMTAEEKISHPEYETIHGYLKTLDFPTTCRYMWDSLTPDEKQKVCEIPNFDPDVFREITGIDVTDGVCGNAEN